MKVAALVALVAGCSDPGTDVVGPFTGPRLRYVVDHISVPRDATEAEAAAADLDGNGKPDNKFGYATAVLAGTNDLSTHATDMIAAGRITSLVYIQADSLVDDDSVGISYAETAVSDGQATGGRFVDGALISNRTVDTQHPAVAYVELPVFINADPVRLPIERFEIELAPDGAGGFDATLRGVMNEFLAREQARAALVQMIATEPERHLVFERGVDDDHDGVISMDEVEASIIGLLVAGDVEIAGKPYVSIGFSVHLTPCADGSCSSAVPQDTCRDRVWDAGESDVDCGGPCQRCADGLRCGAAADCQSNACDPNGCRAATCSDGVRDGIESDIDCGATCPPCMVGDTCAADRDCAGNNCDNLATLGSCR